MYDLKFISEQWNNKVDHKTIFNKLNKHFESFFKLYKTACERDFTYAYYKTTFDKKVNLQYINEGRAAFAKQSILLLKNRLSKFDNKII